MVTATTRLPVKSRIRYRIKSGRKSIVICLSAPKSTNWAIIYTILTLSNKPLPYTTLSITRLEKSKNLQTRESRPSLRSLRMSLRQCPIPSSSTSLPRATPTRRWCTSRNMSERTSWWSSKRWRLIWRILGWVDNVFIIIRHLISSINSYCCHSKYKSRKQVDIKVKFILLWMSCKMFCLLIYSASYYCTSSDIPLWTRWACPQP